MRVVFFAAALPATPHAQISGAYQRPKKVSHLTDPRKKLIQKIIKKMEITGRLVADATVRKTKDDKKVTGFRVAINRRYKSGGEQKEETTYVDCSFWRGERLAPYLTKGLLVQLYGHMSSNAWVSKDGELMSGLRFHTNEITLLGASGNRKEVEFQA